MPANTAVPIAVATTRAANTNNAGSSRRFDAARYRNAEQARSRRGLLNATARDIEKYFFERCAVVARHDAVGTIVVHDTAALHDNDAIAQPLHFKHVVRRQQDGGAAGAAIGLQMPPDPVGGVGIERGRGLVEQQ